MPDAIMACFLSTAHRYEEAFRDMSCRYPETPRVREIITNRVINIDGVQGADLEMTYGD